MKIVVITGSPHREGTSALLARKFEDGAREAGHEIYRFDAAFEDVAPCIGCDKCGCGARPCVMRDAMDKLYPKLCEADLIAFVTPLYYHGPSAQFKAAVDRFHGIDDFLRGADKRAVLIVTAADARTRVTRGLEAEYEETLNYLGWRDAGRVLALGCYYRADIEKTDYPEAAYRLGRNL